MRNDRVTGENREDTTLVHVLERRAAAEGARPAYVFLADGERDERRLTYAELAAWAGRVAAALGARTEPATTALLLCPPGLELIAALFACFRARVVAVPVYPPDPRAPDRGLGTVEAIALDARARVVVTTASLRAWLEPLLATGSVLRTLDWIAVDALPADAVVDAGGERPAAGAVAFLQYTSGSTGHPRGVMVTHRNLIAHGDQVIARLAMRPDSVVVSWLPLYHDMGLVGTVLLPIQVGCLSVQLSPLDFLERPGRWLRAITRYGGTVSPAPNFAYDLVVRRTAPEERRPLDLATWTAAMNGAEPVRAATCERFVHAFEPHGFRRTAFVPCYGLAEATLMVAGGPAGDGPVVATLEPEALARGRVVGTPDGRPMVACGRVLPDLEVTIVEPGTDRRCAPDEIGEILVAGPSIAAGYWERPAETAAVFGGLVPERRGDGLRTGDLGFVRDGFLFVTGRLKDLVVVRGRNHYPQDLEHSAADAHPALRPGGGAAFTCDDGEDERLVVVQECRADDPETLAAVAAAMRERLVREHGLDPATIVLIPPRALPKTSSGKVRRRACRTAFQRGTLPVRHVWRAPAGARAGAAALEAWLAASIAELRGLPADAVHPDAALAGLGFDSAEVAEVAVLLEARLGRPVPLKLLVQHGSIRSLAAALAEARR